MDDMNAEMKVAEKHLTGMEKWCGLCVCPWNKAPAVKDMDATWGKGEGSSSKAVSSQPGGSGGARGGASFRVYPVRINNYNYVGPRAIQYAYLILIVLDG